MYAALVEQQCEQEHLSRAEYRVAIVLDSTGNLHWVSPECASVLGYARDELLRARSRDMIHPQDLPRVKVQFRAMLRESKKIETNFRCKGKNGGHIDLHIKGLPVVQGQSFEGYLILLKEQSSIDLAQFLCHMACETARTR